MLHNHVSISELRFLSLIVYHVDRAAHRAIPVSISELRFLSLIVYHVDRAAHRAIPVSISELRFLSLIVAAPWFDEDDVVSFNLRIEILIVDSPRRRSRGKPHSPVSISELRFLSLIGGGRGNVQVNKHGSFNLRIEILIVDRTRRRPHTLRRRRVSISELRFLSLIGAVVGIQGAIAIEFQSQN